MSKVIVDMGMSLDGFIAGPNGDPRNALGNGGHRILRWGWRTTTSRSFYGNDR
jgi:hypothetical protein